MRYRCGDHEVEAIQYQAPNTSALFDFLRRRRVPHDVAGDGRAVIQLHTAGTPLEARIGDWVIWAEGGEMLGVMAPEVFAANFTLLADNAEKAEPPNAMRHEGGCIAGPTMSG